MLKKVTLGTLALIAILAITGIIVFCKVTKMNYTKLNKSNEALGIKVQTTPQAITTACLIRFQENSLPTTTLTLITMPISIPQPTLAPAHILVPVPVPTSTTAPSHAPYKPTTIALFGVDRTNQKSNGRSDVIMLLTIDEVAKKIKLSSLMRDLYVHIDGHGYTKLNHAYSYGGPQLAIKTLNENFDLEIRDFCTVDFFDMEKIIDAAGGVMVTVEENEVYHINDYTIEAGTQDKQKFSPVVSSGLQRLNGAKAVAYSRIRYIGHGDFDRTGRQREVLEALFHQIKGMGLKSTLGFLSDVFPCVETSLSRLEIYKITREYFEHQPMAIEETRFPVDGTWKSGKIKGIYYIQADMVKLKDQLQRYIYHDIMP